MRANEDALAAELRSRHGVTTTKRLAALGITRRIDRRARSISTGSCAAATACWCVHPGPTVSNTAWRWRVP